MLVCVKDGLFCEIVEWNVRFLVVGGLIVMNVEGFVLCTVGKMAQDVGIRPVGRGGSRGFARTPLFASKSFYMHRSPFK